MDSLSDLLNTSSKCRCCCNEASGARWQGNRGLHKFHMAPCEGDHHTMVYLPIRPGSYQQAKHFHLDALQHVARGKHYSTGDWNISRRHPMFQFHRPLLEFLLDIARMLKMFCANPPWSKGFHWAPTSECFRSDVCTAPSPCKKKGIATFLHSGSSTSSPNVNSLGSPDFKFHQKSLYDAGVPNNTLNLSGCN